MIVRTRKAALIAAALLGAGVARAGEAGLPWLSNLSTALKQASASGKPVLVDVGAVWCVPCRQMEERTYPDPAVREQADGFVLVKVDADAQVPVVQRYDVSAFPTVLFLDAKGGEIARRTGFQGASDLAARMKAVRGGYERYASSRAGSAADEFVGDFLSGAGNPKGAADAYKRAVKALPDDAARREACEMKLAEAEGRSGQERAAAAIFERLSSTSPDPTRRGAALRALIKTEIAMGKHKEAEASLARLAKEFPDLPPPSDDPTGASASR